jgi:hypothetical protein
MAKPRRRAYLCDMIKIRLLLIGAACVVLLPAGPAWAAKEKKSAAQPAAASPATPPPADPGLAKSLGNAGSWTAYVAQNKEGKICYVVGRPEKVDPSIKRKAVMAMVTHRTADNVSNVVSFDAGYPLNENDDVIVEAGGSKFTLFAKDDLAWARTSELDRAIVTALAREKRVLVKAAPKKGKETVDTYSLGGFSKTLGMIDKACGVKR